MKRIPFTSIFLFITTSLFAQTKTIEQKIDILLEKMTLEGKLGMIHANFSFTSNGVPRLAVPELVTSDGR